MERRFIGPQRYHKKHDTPLSGRAFGEPVFLVLLHKQVHSSAHGKNTMHVNGL
jgi:hypothetical protein